jgi:hypothetical protein
LKQRLIIWYAELETRRIGINTEAMLPVCC